MTQNNEKKANTPLTLVGASLFREGMSRLAAAVHIAATDGEAGRSGMTVSAVTSVTDAPATLIVCVNSGSHFCQVVERNGVFSLNLLAAADRTIAEAFGGAKRLPPEKRFEIGTWLSGQSGAPLLTSALVSFDCRLSGSDVVATHRVLMGEVIDVRLGDQSEALLYWQRVYRHLGETE